ncbi:unnamed protein product [Cylindrotheca closterium]|uniref:Uncharacterized protein n=1 Tax=Cylindrotheca closterium TaxID=2856 RepID=A0AAD2JGR3_9STRA|nr:unnamed protein product [Cylindrotheca closterium]
MTPRTLDSISPEAGCWLLFAFHFENPLFHSQSKHQTWNLVSPKQKYWVSISFHERLSTFLYFYHPPSKMAAAIPVFTIYDAMILCQIPDTGNFQGQTDAQRMAEELFDNDFGTAMTKSIKQVNMDLATLASLTAVQGRIAFVQWVRDEIRMGRNPAQHPFPAGDTSTLLQRLNFHQKYVKDSKTLIDNTVPPKWSKEQQWKQWVKLLRDHLRAYIGVNGIPLVYVVRENAAQDPTPQDDFLDEYINMALLVGTAFIVDNKQVLALLNKFIMGCSEAEMVIQALNTTTDGRAAFFALKAFYEGEGIFAHDVMETRRLVDCIPAMSSS